MELRTDRFKLKEIFPEKVKKYAQKMHKKAGEIEFVRKGIPIDPKDITIKEGERAAIRLVTTPHLDRDSEILIPKGAILDDFRQAPTVLYAHDYKGLPIGSDKWLRVENEGILAKTFYANHQFAEDVYQCVKDGHLRSNSVGFIPVESVTPEDKKLFGQTQEILEKDYGISKDESGKAKNIYTKWIMLEHSDVPVASNTQSLNLAVAKGELNIQSERLKKDLEIAIVKDREIELKNKENKVKWIIERDDEIQIIKNADRNCEHYWRQTYGVEDMYYCKKCGALGEKKIIPSFGNLPEKEIIITKPETTAQYHRIPVSEGHSGHRIRTITISAAQGIKALYCGQCKKVITYLFDVKKWTMEEAKKWVQEHKDISEAINKYFTKGVTPETEKCKNIISQMIKEADAESDGLKRPQYKERWNIKALSRRFDIAEAESPRPLAFNFELFEKFLECKIKSVFLNTYTIPSPLLGTYLAGFKEVLSEYELKDTRSFDWRGEEYPPQYEVIHLNSEKSDDFLIEGMCFYEAEEKPLIVKYNPTWDGMTVSFVTSKENKEWNKGLMDKVHAWVQENNFLKGEKFALCGEFITEPQEEWDSLILDAKYKDSIKKSADTLEKKKDSMLGRGLLLIGPPGTGKTKTGRVLMTNLDTTFIWVSSRDFRHVGPLKAITLSYSLARDLAPSILFIEDIDTWLKDYGDRDSVVVDLIKTEMDGLRQNKGILTIMTSNYPEKLPDALLDRPGRFHHIINFELPDEKQRREMIRMWIEEKHPEPLENPIPKEVIELTEGFSGAHIKELIEFATMIAEEEDIEIGDALLKSLEKLTEQRELIEEIRGNKVEVKEFWIKMKWLDGDIEIKKDLEIEIEKHDEQIKEYQKECEHEWVDITSKDMKNLKEYSCSKCGLERLEPTEESISDKLTAKVKITDMEEFNNVIKEIRIELAELKEGRVLSTKNRTLVKDTIEALTTLKERLDELYTATEPVAREEEREPKGHLILERDIKKEDDPNDKIISVIENFLTGAKAGELLKNAVSDAVETKIKKRMGVVE